MTLNDYLTAVKRAVRIIYPHLAPDYFDLCFSASIPAWVDTYQTHRAEFQCWTEQEIEDQILAEWCSMAAPSTTEVQ
ncbi:MULTISPECIES: hypothetical protein [Acidobacterium]|uniref:Uncharacterized protein n=1 Tax=Acidobacterium capsulatum (strain ATCC 51196 / DSM 11244 / BCRC 80197 / JCM 7670 / NBRC 15755 / NCIMB 13165 / 161) TaxID=240015 RepID=C1FA05_ACIC5|nr:MULTISPECIES: hypothetical protein [Acidobacterium]ACO33226.1 hypothetical protein ACP_0383 [Acidobacterium capsulatum ATCC 51196]HCT62073.1 hypothetical protein [Acidobacterium sp.]